MCSLWNFIIWIVLVATLVEADLGASWLPLSGCWGISTVAELVVLGLRLPLPHLALVSGLIIAFQMLRLALLGSLLLLLFHKTPRLVSSKKEESSSLLDQESRLGVEQISSRSSNYGTVHALSQQECQQAAGPTKRSPLLRWNTLDKRLLEAVCTFCSTSDELQTRFALVGLCLCLIVDRILMLLLPRQFGILIDSILIDYEGNMKDIWQSGFEVGLFVLYQYLASPGLLGSFIKFSSWRLQVWAEGNLKVATHKKLLELSLGRQSQDGTVTPVRMIEQGVKALHLLKVFSVELLPLAVDIIIGTIFLGSIFGASMFALLCLTSVLIVWSIMHFERKANAIHLESRHLSENETQIL